MAQASLGFRMQWGNKLGFSAIQLDLKPWYIMPNCQLKWGWYETFTVCISISIQHEHTFHICST